MPALRRYQSPLRTSTSIIKDMLDVELYVFYHSISAAVNEFYNIILSVAEVVIGNKGSAIIFEIVNRNSISYSCKADACVIAVLLIFYSQTVAAFLKCLQVTHPMLLGLEHSSHSSSEEYRRFPRNPFF